MACKKGMHPRNPYRDKPPDFTTLAKKHAEFRSHCYIAPNGKVLVSFKVVWGETECCILLKADP